MSDDAVNAINRMRRNFKIKFFLLIIIIALYILGAANVLAFISSINLFAAGALMVLFAIGGILIFIIGIMIVFWSN